jgi:hypothetical protein
MLFRVLEPILWPLTGVFVGSGPRIPRTYDFLVDESGNFLTDESANLLTE